MLFHHVKMLSIYDSIPHSRSLNIREATEYVRSFFASIKRENEWMVNDYLCADQCIDSTEMESCEHNRATGCCFAGSCEESLEQQAKALALAGYERLAESLLDVIGRIYVAEDLLLQNCHDLFNEWTEESIQMYTIFILNHERRHSVQSQTFLQEDRPDDAIKSMSVSEYNNIPSERDANEAGLTAVQEYFHLN